MEIFLLDRLRDLLAAGRGQRAISVGERHVGSGGSLVLLALLGVMGAGMSHAHQGAVPTGGLMAPLSDPNDPPPSSMAATNGDIHVGEMAAINGDIHIGG
jgi:hypothetical protein